jgi:hypothetical protein
MKNSLTGNPVVFSGVILSFTWNIFLLVGVALNLGFVHTRAAGGQFTDFPTAIRVLYLLQLALVMYQAWIFTRIFHSVQIRLKWAPKFFVLLGFFGILLNAASRSSNERWNVIPAAVITWAFWYYGVRREKSAVGS